MDEGLTSSTSLMHLDLVELKRELDKLGISEYE